MVDYVTDLKRRPFILADRTVSTIQLQVLGNIKDHIKIGIRGCDVRSDGSLVINLAPDQAQALAKELMNLARKGRFNGNGLA
jgi:hypothetical protein